MRLPIPIFHISAGIIAILSGAVAISLRKGAEAKTLPASPCRGEGSLFLGQQQVFPAFLRGSPMLFIPAFLPLLLMIFWLVRVRFKNAYVGAVKPHRRHEYGLELHTQAVPDLHLSAMENPRGRL